MLSLLGREITLSGFYCSLHSCYAKVVQCGHRCRGSTLKADLRGTTCASLLQMPAYKFIVLHCKCICALVLFSGAVPEFPLWCWGRGGACRAWVFWSPAHGVGYGLGGDAKRKYFSLGHVISSLLPKQSMLCWANTLCFTTKLVWCFVGERGRGWFCQPCGYLCCCLWPVHMDTTVGTSKGCTPACAGVQRMQILLTSLGLAGGGGTQPQQAQHAEACWAAWVALSGLSVLLVGMFSLLSLRNKWPLQGPVSPPDAAAVWGLLGHCQQCGRLCAAPQSWGVCCRALGCGC